MGVFDASSDAAPKPTATEGKRKKDAGPPASSGTSSVRAPVAGECVAPRGQPAGEVHRTMGRPACRDAQVLEWRDPSGAPRYACVFGAKDPHGPLPLVVFFHDPDDDPTSFDKKTSLRKQLNKALIAPDHPGFIALAPQARSIDHGRHGAVFDADYIGPDNVDVATIDHFVAELSDRKIVDPRRVYALGASLGGHMAATWAMLRADRVAAFSAFATDEPLGAWSCPGPPPPALVIYRACDEIAPCDSVERWLRGRDAAHAETTWLRLDAGNDDEPTCAFKNKCSKVKGTANHHRWPKQREGEILKFFARHALGVGPQDATNEADSADGGAPDAEP